MAINVYAIVTPLILALIVAEFFYCLKTKNGYYVFQDSIASLGTAIVNQTVNLFVALLIFYSFRQLQQTIGIFDIQARWHNYVILYVLIDFLFYWFHRAGHSINIFWAAHMPHHSTEELNYAVALRASVTQRLFSFIFYWPTAVLGFPVEMIIPTVALNLVMQLLPHTRVIPKLGPFIESWLNTPSHHRVHHAINQQYLNKNFGGTFIIWDKLFGSFEPEREEPFYGVLDPPKTWDPIFINFQVWRELARDAWAAPRFIDKFKLWFMPVGWRPSGLPLREPAPILTKETQIKYQSASLIGARWYLLAQLPFGLGLMLLIIHDRTFLALPEICFFSGLIWAMAIGWSALLEAKRWALPFEIGRLALTAISLAIVLANHQVASIAIASTVTVAAIFVAWCLSLIKSNRLATLKSV